MKRLLNTLYVTTDGAYLKKEGEAVVVTVKKEVKMRLPILNLSGIVCFGRVGCSPALLGLCGKRGVAVTFLSMHGRFLARVNGMTHGNVLLRREQYRRSQDKEAAAVIARAFVIGKILNCRTSLQRAMRDHNDLDGVDRAVVELAQLADAVERENDLDKIRGLEGRAARVYFAAFPRLIVTRSEKFPFNGRNRRPPLDPVNALLSFIYTLLLHDVTAALESVGLDPAVGFLHRDRPGRPGLALDIMEEFRPWLADRLALTLINLRQLAPESFTTRETGGVIMDENARRSVLVAYQKRKQEEIQHAFLAETIPIGMTFFSQALLLARHLRGDIDGYPPFFWK